MIEDGLRGNKADDNDIRQQQRKKLVQLCKLLRGCPAEKDVVNPVYQRVDKVSNQKCNQKW